MYITHRMVTEFGFILDCIYELNGHHIFTAASVSHMVDFVESARYVLEVQHSVYDIPNLFVHNKICDRFFSLIPQTGASGVNFFAQVLYSEEIYFCCPPVSQILPCFKKLVSQPGLTAILLIPDWKSHVFLSVSVQWQCLSAADKANFSVSTYFLVQQYGVE